MTSWRAEGGTSMGWSPVCRTATARDRWRWRPSTPISSPPAPRSSCASTTTPSTSSDGGVHVNLYNNLWGTAFPQWYDLDMYYRFTLTVEPGEQG